VLVKNPQTGLLEDDGQPDEPAVEGPAAPPAFVPMITDSLGRQVPAVPEPPPAINPTFAAMALPAPIAPEDLLAQQAKPAPPADLTQRVGGTLSQLAAPPPIAPAPVLATAPRPPRAPAAPATPAVAAHPDAAGQAAVDDEAKLVAQGQQRVAIDKAKAELDVADKNLAANEAHEAAVTQAMADADRFIKAREAKRDAAVDRAANAKITPLEPTMLSAFAIALGGLAGGMQAAGGGPGGNQALAQWNRQVEQNFAEQKTKIENLKDAAAMAQSGVMDARKAREIQLENLNVKQLATLKRLDAWGQQHLRKLGMDEAEISGNAGMVALRQKQLDLQREMRRQDQSDFLADLRTKSEIKLQGAQAGAARANAAESMASARLKDATARGEAGGKTPNDSMLKARGYTSTALQQEKTLSELPPLSQKDAETIRQDLAAEEYYDKAPGHKAAAMRAGLYKGLNEKLSPAAQQYVAAMKEFNNSTLRRESGAAISASEWDAAFDRYGIRAGDSAAVQAQKVANRRAKIREMAIEGGQEPQTQAQIAALPPPGAIPATKGGRRGYIIGGAFHATVQ
jgi:hypothetical protein